MFIAKTPPLQPLNPHPQNTTIIVSWYNMIKVIELIYKPNEGKYVAHKDAKKSIFLNQCYLAGSSLFEVEGSKSRFVNL